MSGPVSITYSVGGSTTSTDSTNTINILNSYGGILTPDTSVCYGNHDVILDLNNSEGEVLKWESSEDGFSSITSIPITDSVLNVLNLTQTTQYRVIVQDGSCEPDTSNSITITVYPQSTAQISGDTIICSGSTAWLKLELTGVSPWDIEYENDIDTLLIPGIPGSPNYINVSPSSITTYTIVTMADGNGCPGPISGSATVDPILIPVSNAGKDSTLCSLSFQFDAVPSVGIGLWSVLSGPGTAVFSPDENDPLATVTVDTEGSYEILWTETNGPCSDADTITVIFHKTPMSDAGPDQVLEYVFSAFMEGRMPDYGTGNWEIVRGTGQILNENDPLTEIRGLSLGENEYTWIIKTDVCDDVSDNVLITVNDIKTQTVITPNNDGYNDYLVFSGLVELSNTEIIIYNRWGTEVYRSKNYQNDWDGRDHNNRELLSDTYYYILKRSSGRIIKGFVEIRR